MNNRAVLLTQTKKWDEGNKLYQDVIEALPEGAPKEEGVFMYNMGLSLLRQNKLAEAIKTLSRIESRHGVNKKVEAAKRLIENSNAALKTNVPLRFSAAVLKVESSEFRRPLSFLIKPGDRGLHHVYNATAFSSQKFQDYCGIGIVCRLLLDFSFSRKSGGSCRTGNRFA